MNRPNQSQFKHLRFIRALNNLRERGAGFDKRTSLGKRNRDQQLAIYVVEVIAQDRAGRGYFAAGCVDKCGCVAS